MLITIACLSSLFLDQLPAAKARRGRGVIRAPAAGRSESLKFRTVTRFSRRTLKTRANAGVIRLSIYLRRLTTRPMRLGAMLHHSAAPGSAGLRLRRIGAPCTVQKFARHAHASGRCGDQQRKNKLPENPIRQCSLQKRESSPRRRSVARCDAQAVTNARRQWPGFADFPLVPPLLTVAISRRTSPPSAPRRASTAS
jgi:hypothetical protein